MRTMRTGVEVDTERLVLDLESLAYEVEEGFAYVNRIKTTVDVGTTEMESVSVEIEFTPTEDSILSGGYEIPYEESD